MLTIFTKRHQGMIRRTKFVVSMYSTIVLEVRVTFTSSISDLVWLRHKGHYTFISDVSDVLI